ncbi:hypothetical protein PV08_02367 [Exophiala spinifera]|uniref:Uncharacterized protein n=1 Tax=Exophiala spinifera TaxID=91928 RepID=A0A0D2BHK1_9EURO|nr:uncharacterized protein PV08_02367 [Exophiala spinifera]KIW18080.1 hypothetical protein PV08_02367 [Exophiala spinifera]
MAQNAGKDLIITSVTDPFVARSKFRSSFSSHVTNTITTSTTASTEHLVAESASHHHPIPSRRPVSGPLSSSTPCSLSDRVTPAATFSDVVVVVVVVVANFTKRAAS